MRMASEYLMDNGPVWPKWWEIRSVSMLLVGKLRKEWRDF